MRDTPARSSGPLLRHELDGFQQEEELLGVQEHWPSKIGGENRPSLLRVQMVSLAFPYIHDVNRAKPKDAVRRCHSRRSPLLAAHRRTVTRIRGARVAPAFRMCSRSIVASIHGG